MQELRDSMQSHLKLHFETEEASDEMVLQAYPATIRCVCWFILNDWPVNFDALPLDASPFDASPDATHEVGKVQLMTPKRRSWAEPQDIL